MTTIRELEGPFLELNLYIPDLSEVEAFKRLVTTLTNLDANFTGKGKAHKGIGIRDKPFASITDDLLQPVIVESTEDLGKHLADRNIRLIQVLMDNATGVVSDVVEVVTYVSISSEAMHADRHPLAIWTEGWFFSGSSSIQQKYKQKARKVGIQIYERFRTLLEVMQPAYAAITSEYSLECPTDLRRDPRSYAFRNFFVSQAYLGPEILARVKTLFADGYIETIGDGIYVSSFAAMNPEGKNIEAELSLKKSHEVAKIIASVKG